MTWRHTSFDLVQTRVSLGIQSPLTWLRADLPSSAPSVGLDHWAQLTQWELKPRELMPALSGSLSLMLRLVSISPCQI